MKGHSGGVSDSSGVPLLAYAERLDCGDERASASGSFDVDGRQFGEGLFDPSWTREYCNGHVIVTTKQTAVCVIVQPPQQPVLHERCAITALLLLVAGCTLCLLKMLHSELEVLLFPPPRPLTGGVAATWWRLLLPAVLLPPCYIAGILLLHWWRHTFVRFYEHRLSMGGVEWSHTSTTPGRHGAQPGGWFATTAGGATLDVRRVFFQAPPSGGSTQALGASRDWVAACLGRMHPLEGAPLRSLHSMAPALVLEFADSRQYGEKWHCVPWWVEGEAAIDAAQATAGALNALLEHASV